MTNIALAVQVILNIEANVDAKKATKKMVHQSARYTNPRKF